MSSVYNKNKGCHSSSSAHAACATVSSFAVVGSRSKNGHHTSDRCAFPLCFSGGWSDMMHSLLCRQCTRRAHVTGSLHNKASADCQCSTRSRYSGAPCPCQGSKQTLKTIYAVQRVWPSLWVRGRMESDVRKSVVGVGRRLSARRLRCC